MITKILEKKRKIMMTELKIYNKVMRLSFKLRTMRKEEKRGEEKRKKEKKEIHLKPMMDT